jgi:EmrB/QacA subfamily drug resistance transporter
MSVVGVPMLLGPVLGPVIGGLLVTHLSWRWIFFVNLPIGIVGLILAARLLPTGRAESRHAGPTRLDWRGLLMLSPGVALVVFGLSEVSTHGSLTLSRVLPILVGIVLVVAFVLHAFRVPAPLVDVRLLEHRGFAAAGVTVFLVGAALFGTLLVVALYFQLGRGQSALEAGLLMAPQGLGAAVGMNRAGILTDRIGGGPVVVAGLLMLILGTVPFALVEPNTPYWLLELALILRGVGLGFTMMPAMAAAYATIKRSEVPRATPMLNVMQRVGGSLGTAVLAVVLQRSLATNGHSPAGVADAFGHTYWWAIGITALALLPALVLAQTQRAARREAAASAAPEAGAPAAPVPTVG